MTPLRCLANSAQHEIQPTSWIIYPTCQKPNEIANSLLMEPNSKFTEPKQGSSEP